MKSTIGLLSAAMCVTVLGCTQTDPESVCNHIARLQHPGAEDRAKDYARRCPAPMTEAKFNRPEEYRCWSKCILGVRSWPDSVRCDGCVGAHADFELFQLSKTRKKQEPKSAPDPAASGSAAPEEAGVCGSTDAACGP